MGYCRSKKGLVAFFFFFFLIGSFYELLIILNALLFFYSVSADRFIFISPASFLEIVFDVRIHVFSVKFQPLLL